MSFKTRLVKNNILLVTILAYILNGHYNNILGFFFVDTKRSCDLCKPIDVNSCCPFFLIFQYI